MPKEFAFISFFRAFAALWVLVAHCMIWGDWYGIPLPSAKLAVDLFMIISGFLMAANAASREAFEPLTTWRNGSRFLLRRFFRIAPAYYLSLFLAVVLSTYFLGGYHDLQSLNPAKWPPGTTYDPLRISYTPTNLLLHVSFLFGLHPTYSFSTFLPDWSLSLEMQFYVVFPLLLASMAWLGYGTIALLSGAMVLVATPLIARHVVYFEPSLLVMKLSYFVAGILLFRTLHTPTSVAARWWIGLISLGLLMIESPFYGSDVVTLPLIWLVMLYWGNSEISGTTPQWVADLSHHRWVRFASDASYGVYLFHGFFIAGFGLLLVRTPWLIQLAPLPRVALMIAGVGVLTYVTAHLVHRLVEQPGINVGKKIIARIAPLRPAPPQR